MHANIPIFVPHVGCPHSCSFCNQRVISGKVHVPDAQETAEICADALRHLSQKYDSVEIAFFGGSFTAISQDLMISLLESAARFLADKRVSGIRVSTRPDAINNEKLDILKYYGVTAIELGAQSMYNKVLEQNRRGHTAEDVVMASALVREYGFELGLQMMTGLWGSNSQMDCETGRQIAKIKPDTVRIYPTVVIQGTELEQKMQSGEYLPQSLEEAVETAAWLLELFESSGIRVIRLGLHASELLEGKAGGGVYHPAMGELSRSRIYYKKLLEQLNQSTCKRVKLYALPQKISQIIGQKRCNIEALQQQGYQIEVISQQDLTTDYRLQEVLD